VGNHFDFSSRMWEPGTGYNWTIFNERRHDKTINGGSFTMYSALNSVWLLYMNVAFYALLTWYFDIVVETNRGRGQRFYFFLQPSYWGFGAKKKRTRVTVDDLRNPAYNIKDEEESVTKERMRVLRNFNSNELALGMRIKGLSKTFAGMCSKNRVEALKALSL
jgi:hypothetical protein